MSASRNLPLRILNWGVYQIRLFFIALQFFTRIPIPRWVGFEPAWLQHASRYFPLVGLVVAAVVAAIYQGAVFLFPHAPVVAVWISMIGGIYCTGAFHEDGFADVCDGFGGGPIGTGTAGRERVLEIMVDSRVGAYGAIGVVLMLGLKGLALGSLAPDRIVGALLIAHPLSRLASTSLIWVMRYAKAAGKAKPIAQQMSGGEFLIAVSSVVLIVGGVYGLGSSGCAKYVKWEGCGNLLIGMLFVLASTLFMARKFQARIQGFTGDCLGAVQQVAEVAFYLGLLADFGSLDWGH